MGLEAVKTRPSALRSLPRQTGATIRKRALPKALEPDGEVLNISEGICDGTITFSPRGNNGFGYDPLFVPDGYSQTFAELPDTIKNLISHRARALIGTREFLSQLDHPSVAS